MKKNILFQLRSLFCALLLTCSFISSYASHIVGTDLGYTHMTGNTYKITIALYGACGPLSAVAFATLPTSAPQICIYNHDTLITNIALAIDTPASGVEITPLCTGDSSQCTSPTSIRPGVMKFVYSATYTFPYASSAWRLLYGGYNNTAATAGRAAAITNIAMASSTTMQLTDTLNNMVYSNTSPDLTVTQQTFFCVNQHDIYNPGAVDPDGDSLSINLIDAENGNAAAACAVGGPVTYTSTTAWPAGPVLSAADPLQVAGVDSFSMNSATGGMFFHSIYQRSVVVYNIREFRSGNFVGTSQREMTVLVVSCDTLFPCMYVAAPVISHVGVSGLSQVKNTNLYPNPAGDELTVDISSGSYSSFAITNTIGDLLLQQPLNTAKTKININTFPPGMYYITLKGEQGIEVRKFIKQ